ncbi:MAG: GTP-binding protein [Oscillochloris sp.]|nr:GTP-binding protein [Oscillochloris sp.]
MKPLKIVITGAYAAGKTSFIRTISDGETLTTDYQVSLDEELALKSETTVALDFGTIAISDDVTLFLFGTPGQDRFDFMWEILSEGCLGYVVLVDSCRPAHLSEAARLIQRFSIITDAPFVVAASHQDDPAALPVSYIRRRLPIPSDCPVIPCTTTNRESLKAVLLALLEQVNRSFVCDEPIIRSA